MLWRYRDYHLRIKRCDLEFRSTAIKMAASSLTAFAIADSSFESADILDRICIDHSPPQEAYARLLGVTRHTNAHDS